MIAYHAMLDVPRELVGYVSRLLAAERRARGTRRGSRALTCWKQALFVVAWFGKQDDLAVLGAGFGISRATAYRYHSEGVTVLAEQAPDLHEALARAHDEGLAYVILDGKIFDADRSGEQTTSVKGQQIDLWYSGKAHTHGGNVQALSAPTGLPLWIADAEPGSVHDLIAAREHVLAALYRAASQLDLPPPADSGYEGAGIGVHTPIKQPAGGRSLDPDNRTYNALLRGLRCLGERGFAVLIGRWRALRHFTCGPEKIGTIVKAALVLTHYEHGRIN
ncbi:transposase family protein [Nocardia arizonensis]|uniref:transposase family protein n=2 Tax=Nocardia arizonensis TaxID=1141647 RepID=UPI0007A74486|nr:transposase family protein [Nocardia arizonensis]